MFGDVSGNCFSKYLINSLSIFIILGGVVPRVQPNRWEFYSFLGSIFIDIILIMFMVGIVVEFPTSFKVEDPSGNTSKPKSLTITVDILSCFHSHPVDIQMAGIPSKASSGLTQLE
jgi:RsiW-degrading membrane proteinase PrsW (M82 family)